MAETEVQAILDGIDRREALARAAIESSEMHPYGDLRLPALPIEEWPDEIRGALGGTWGEHCAANDPSHVLAVLATAREDLADAAVQRKRHSYDAHGDDLWCAQCDSEQRPCPDAQQAARTLARLTRLYA